MKMRCAPQSGAHLIFQRSLHGGELILAHLAQGAHPVLGHIGPGGAGGHAVIRIAHLGVVDIAADICL